MTDFRVCVHDISFSRPLMLEMFKTEDEAVEWYKAIGSLEDLMKGLPYEVLFQSLEQNCGGEWILMNRRMIQR